MASRVGTARRPRRAPRAPPAPKPLPSRARGASRCHRPPFTPPRNRPTLSSRCPGASERRDALERRKTSKSPPETENENGGALPEPPGTLAPEADGPGAGTVPAERTPTSAALPAWTEAPGLDNPAFEEGVPADATQQPPGLPEGEITTIEIHRSNPYIQLGISIVGGNETPLINIVIQEVYRDGVIARDGRLLAGDQILQVATSVLFIGALLF